MERPRLHRLESLDAWKAILDSMPEARALGFGVPYFNVFLGGLLLGANHYEIKGDSMPEARFRV